MEDGLVWSLQEWAFTDFANIASALTQSPWHISGGHAPGLRSLLIHWFVCYCLSPKSLLIPDIAPILARLTSNCRRQLLPRLHWSPPRLGRLRPRRPSASKTDLPPIRPAILLYTPRLLHRRPLCLRRQRPPPDRHKLSTISSHLHRMRRKAIRRRYGKHLSLFPESIRKRPFTNVTCSDFPHQKRSQQWTHGMLPLRTRRRNRRIHRPHYQRT